MNQETELILEVKSQRLEDIPAPQDLIHTPIDVVVGGVGDPVQNSLLQPESLGDGRIEFMAVVIGDEADTIGIVPEVQTKVGVAEVNVKGGGIIARPDEKSEVSFIVISITHGQLPGHAKSLCEIESCIQA